MKKYLATLFCSRVSDLFKLDHKTLTAFLSIVALLTSLGFLLGDTSSSNYHAIIAFAASNTWAIWFFIYGLEKFIELMFDIPPYIKALNSLFGLWLWNYFVLSFLFFDKSSTHPLEYTLLSPLFLELWFLTSLIYLVSTRKE